MKKILFCFICLFVFSPINTYAISNSAHSMTIIDTDSNRVLYEKNGNEKSLIASTTNIMTI